MKTIIACILVAALATAAPAADAPRQEFPDHVAASILTLNPGPMCSGTIISRGQTWACGISAAHCFKGLIYDGNGRGQFKVQYPDGEEVEAKLLAIDRTLDLARFAVPAASVLSVSQLAVRMPPTARYEACGYPAYTSQTRELYYYHISPSSDSVSRDPGKVRWKFTVDNGGVIPGCSGCGVFANGQLCGVLSHNDAHQGHVCYVCPASQVAEFLERTDRAGCAAWKMGNWRTHPVLFEDAPPLLSVQSGAAIRFPHRNAPKIAAPAIVPRIDIQTQMTQVPPPPPDADSHDEPERRPPQGRQAPQNQNLYDGHGRPPKDYRTPRQRSKHLIEDESRIDQLEQELDDLKSRQPEKGDQGDPGNDLTPPDITPPEPGHPMLAVVGFFGCILAGLVVDVIHRTRN